MSTPTSSAPSSPKADKSKRKHAHHHDVDHTKVPATEPRGGPGARDVLLFLIASRLLNALVVQTFFQPDEYFQALEPAWDLAFGKDSGAWITWVCLCALNWLASRTDVPSRNGRTTSGLRSIPPYLPLPIRAPTGWLVCFTSTAMSELNCCSWLQRRYKL